MKYKTLILMLLVGFIFFQVGCKNDGAKKEFYKDYSYYSDESRIEALKWDWFEMEAYNKMLEKHVFYKATFEEVKEAIEGKKKAVIYFGFNPELYQCPYCAAALPLANEAALESKIDKILYLDIYQMRKDETEEYKWLLSFIKEQCSDVKEKILVPDFYVVQDGKILSHHVATLSYEKEDGSSGYLKGMTAEQKLELKNIYLEMFK